MASIQKLLYPPLVDTAMDSFLRNEPCKVYFDLNDYNTAAEVFRVQAIVYRQKNNAFALNQEFYPAHVLEYDLEPSDNKAKGQYFIKIYPGDVENCICYPDNISQPGGFPIDEYFKVQLRFVGAGLPTSQRKIVSQTIIDVKSQQTGNSISSHGAYAGVTSQYLAENKDYFSEWSTICLFRGINKPLISIKGEDASSTATQNRITYKKSVVDVVGELAWLDPITGLDVSDNEQFETLQAFRIKVYNVINSTSILLCDSEWQYPTSEDSSKQQILYKVPHNFVREQTYQMTVDIETSFGYQPDTMTLQKFQILPIELEEQLTDYNFVATPNDEEGYIHLQLTGTFLGNLCIRRSSSESNFTEWVDLKYIPIMTDIGQLNFEFNDLTVKSGVFYKYGVQRISKTGQRGELQELGSTTTGTYTLTPLFDHAYLTTGGRQLKIKYDRSISSLKRSVNESVTETLGSKYPFVRRNSNVDYKTFSISGLITYQADEKHLLISQNDLHRQTNLEVTNIEYYSGSSAETAMSNYAETTTVDSISPNVGLDKEATPYSTFGEYKYNLRDTSLQMIKNRIAQSYNEYNFNHNISATNDYTLEREFREAVMDFLYEDSVKLFKSAAEGNILVKLTDISLEPKEGLQGLVYSFSCTAQEVAEFTLDNCRKFGIQTLGELADSFSSVGTAFGQVRHKCDSGEDLVQLALEMQNKSIITEDYQYTYNIDHMKWIRIEFQSDPYYIDLQGGNKYRTYDSPPSAEVAKSLLYGYIFKLYLQDDGGRVLFVDPQGRFEMIDAGDIGATTDIFETTIYNTYIMVTNDLNDDGLGKTSMKNLYEIALDNLKNVSTTLDAGALESLAIDEAERMLSKLDIYEDFCITGLECCHKGDVIHLDYQCAIEKEYVETALLGQDYGYIAGQVFDTFVPMSLPQADKDVLPHFENLYQYLVKKHGYTKYEYTLTQLSSGVTKRINSSRIQQQSEIGAFGPVTIEAPPGTVCYIADRYHANTSLLNDDMKYRHVIGDTGVLDLAAKNASESDIGFQDVSFNGIHLDYAPNPIYTWTALYNKAYEFINNSSTKDEQGNYISYEELLRKMPLTDEESYEGVYAEAYKQYLYNHHEGQLDITKLYDMTSGDKGSQQCVVTVRKEGKTYCGIANPDTTPLSDIITQGIVLKSGATERDVLQQVVGKPIPNGVYELRTLYNSPSETVSYWCYYNNEWVRFQWCNEGAREQEGGDVLCVVPALIDYYVATEVRTYSNETK